MASSFPGKKEFLAIIPDKPDALERRLKVRPYVEDLQFTPQEKGI
jgi:hypothetical protein